jgi:steroid 5-alpha reductase family enzyme
MSRLAAMDRAAALAVVAACYAVAGVAAAVAVAALPPAHPITVTLVADLVATVVVFAASTVLANASLYDPYWSVAPPVVAVAWALVATDGVGARQALVVGLVLAWSARLTANWATGWRGLGHEDWRYVQLREQTAGRSPGARSELASPAAPARSAPPWWVVNLLGIQVMPTLVVFAGMLSLWPALAGDRPLGALDVLAVVVTAAAIAVEAVADRQVRAFTADPANRDRPIERGLWRWSRHPNYLGEIGFWWGLWLFGLAAAPDWWWTVVGPLAMVLLFEAISIPLMEERTLRRRPAYADTRARVPRLLPRPRRPSVPHVDGDSGR